MRNCEARGKLYLIGAGPGDPELLTLKAARVLRECDVILYDRLVSPEVLSFARADAELIYAGKHPGEQHQTQDQIFRLIRQHALAGKVVARLKGGDPMVFGRGAEEWAVARECGIAVEVIPGISSATSVPTLAGIPLTFRGVAESFAVVTGHCREGLNADWRKYAAIDTLAILMGVTNRLAIARALMDAGRAAEEPVAFVQHGSLPNERTIESTLGAVARGETAIGPPAVFIVGQVVKLRAKLIDGAVPLPPELVAAT